MPLTFCQININPNFYILINDKNDLVNNDVAYDKLRHFLENVIPCPFPCMLYQMPYQIMSGYL